MDAKYCSEWMTRDGEAITVTSSAVIDIHRMFGRIGAYDSAMDKEWGAARADELDEQLDEYFIIGDKKYTAMEKQWWEQLQKDNVDPDVYDKHHNGIIT